MENRNKVLHEQIDTLTARTEKLIGEYNVDDGNDTGSPDGGDGTAIVLEQTQQSEAQLRRLVKYLRNEKQVIQAEMELAKSERLRAKHRADLLERQLDEARIQIMSHSEADSSGAKAAEERQAKLMKQTQQISLLEESNIKYHQIDPAIHEEKMKELEETKEELDSLNKAYAKMRQTIMPKLKQTVRDEKQRADKASKELKTFKEKAESLEQEVASLGKSNERLRKVANLLKQQKLKQSGAAATNSGTKKDGPTTAKANKNRNDANTKKGTKGGKGAKGKVDEDKVSTGKKKQKINVPKANEKSKRGKNKGVVDVKKAAVVSSKAEVKEVSSTKVSKSDDADADVAARKAKRQKASDAYKKKLKEDMKKKMQQLQELRNKKRAESKDIDAATSVNEGSSTVVNKGETADELADPSEAEGMNIPGLKSETIKSTDAEDKMDGNTDNDDQASASVSKLNPAASVFVPSSTSSLFAADTNKKTSASANPFLAAGVAFGSGNSDALTFGSQPTTFGTQSSASFGTQSTAFGSKSTDTGIEKSDATKSDGSKVSAFGVTPTFGDNSIFSSPDTGSSFGTSATSSAFGSSTFGSNGASIPLFGAGTSSSFLTQQNEGANVFDGTTFGKKSTSGNTPTLQPVQEGDDEDEVEGADEGDNDNGGEAIENEEAEAVENEAENDMDGEVN
eukprot:g6020.t1